MNGKKAKLLRKLAKMNIIEENKGLKFKEHTKNEFNKVFLVPSDTPNAEGEKVRKVYMTLNQTTTDKRSAGYYYRQMKKSYNLMRPIYFGMKSQDIKMEAPA